MIRIFFLLVFYEGELELLGSINGTDIKVLREWVAVLHRQTHAASALL